MPHHSSHPSSSQHKTSGLAIMGTGTMAPSGFREKMADKVGSLFGKSPTGSTFDPSSSSRGDRDRNEHSRKHHGSSSHHRGPSTHRHDSSCHHCGPSTYQSSSRPTYDQRDLTSHARPSMAMMPFESSLRPSMAMMPFEGFQHPSMGTAMNGHSAGPRSYQPPSTLRPSAYGPSSALSRYPSQMATALGPGRTVEYEVEYSMKVKYSER